jgi:multicomponent Na+:H+ antiporter subunit C
MSLVQIVIAAALFGFGTYLVLQRTLTRIIIGLALIGNGANVLIVGGARGTAPVLADGVDPATVADPLPQAMVLTAIVITFGITALLLGLALRSLLLTGTDAVEDDIEDRRIAREERTEERLEEDPEMREELS